MGDLMMSDPGWLLVVAGVAWAVWGFDVLRRARRDATETLPPRTTPDR